MSKTATDVEAQVLEFVLDEKKYCVDIAHVDEIVDKDDNLTQLPNSPAHVVGVMDLRGTTATIVNPKAVLGLGGQVIGKRVIVFETADTDDHTVGWVVDEVDQVVQVTDKDVDESVEGESVDGLIRREEGFVIWIDPTTINANA